MFGRRVILAGAAAAVIAALPLAIGIADELEYQKKRREGAEERKRRIVEEYEKRRAEQEGV